MAVTALIQNQGFNPKQLGSSVLLAWYDAGSFVGSDGDAVGTWADSSGNGRDITQGTAGKKPTYKTNILNGKPVMRFDGGDTLTASSNYFNLANKHTCFVVCKQTSVANEEIFANSSTGYGLNWRFRNNGGTQQLRIVRGQHIGDANTGIGANTWAYYTAIMRSTTGASGTMTQRANGADIGTSGSSTCNAAGGTTNVSVGSLSDALEWLIGDMAELIICEGELSTLQYTQVEKYLKQKYAL